MKIGEIKQLLEMNENEKKEFYRAYIELIEEKIKLKSHKNLFL